MCKDLSRCGEHILRERVRHVYQKPCGKERKYRQALPRGPHCRPSFQRPRGLGPLRGAPRRSQTKKNQTRTVTYFTLGRDRGSVG
jgi:hypothetical protein